MCISNMFYINSGDRDPQQRFISVGNGDREEISPASVHGDPRGKKKTLRGPR
jgi:hypothetical protein